MSLRDTINHEKRGSCKTLEGRGMSSFRATPAKAGGDPESRPAQSGIQRIVDSGFRRNDGISDSFKSLMKKLFRADFSFFGN
jgi:hypothetical protein